MREFQALEMVDITCLEEFKHNARNIFDLDAQAELVDSVRAMGIITPLLVTKHGPLYRLIAGARRLRAAKTVGLQAVPCVVMTADEEDKLADMQRLFARCYDEEKKVTK